MTILAGNQTGSGGVYGKNAGNSRVSKFTAVAAGTANKITANVTSAANDVCLVAYSSGGPSNEATTLLGYGIVPAGQTGLQSIDLNTPIAITVGQIVWLGISESGTLERDDGQSISMLNGVDADDGTPEATFVKSTGQNYGAPVIYLEQTGPVATLANDLQPGASFTLNYSNYDAVPVSPVTITDSNNNSITVPVTINDNGDGTGTATGTMPSLPSSGTSQGLLFGNVTVELGT